jgi:hypothetical protein
LLEGLGVAEEEQQLTDFVAKTGVAQVADLAQVGKQGLDDEDLRKRSESL